MYSKKTSKTRSQTTKFRVNNSQSRFKKTSLKISLLWILALIVTSVPMVYEPITGQTPVAQAACSVPSNPSILGGSVTFSNINVNGTGTNCVTVNPGAAINVSLNYKITDAPCPGCIDWIQVGFSQLSGPSHVSIMVFLDLLE